VTDRSIGDFPYLRRLLYGIGLFTLIIVVGTVGYHFILGCSFFDGFYQTVITVSTVEVQDFGSHTGAKIFTLVIVLVGMGNLLFLVSTFAAFFSDGEFRRLLERKRMDNEIRKLTDHVIVCGGNDEIGTYVILELLKTEHRFVVVSERFDPRAWPDHRLLYIQGDPSNDEVLRRAGIESALGIISILPEDKDNVFVTITARGLNPRIRIVAKCVDTRTGEKLVKAGADSVVNPDFIGGMRIASELLRPAAVTFLDKMLRVESRSAIRFEDMKVGKGSEFEGLTLREAAFSKRFNILVVGVRGKGEEDFVYSPPSDYRLEEGTELVVLGELTAINAVKRLCKGGK